MNKIYFIAPAVAVVAFFGYWYSFSNQYKAKIEAEKAAVAKAISDRKAQERADRQKAIDLAVEANAKRKAEREAKQAKEKKEKEDREAAIEERNKIRSEQIKLSAQQERMAKEVEVIKDEITKVELNTASLVAEQSFLKEYVKQAEANAKAVALTAEKIEKNDIQIKSSLKELSTLKANKS